MIARVFAVFCCVFLAACGGSGTGPVGTERPDVFEADKNFAGMLNGVRRENGAGKVTYNAKLDAAAQAHADDMVKRGYFGHASPEGHTVVHRIRAQGYKPVNFGENIAGRQQSDAEVMKAWRNSAAHNRLLMANTVDEFGLAVAGRGSGTRWVLVMASD